MNKQNMKKCLGKSGWLQHGNNYEPHIGSKIGNSLCNKPQLLNNNKDLSFEKCHNDCINNPKCDYFTHGSFKGNKNRSCMNKWKNSNHNPAHPTGRPCIPKNGKNTCDLCYQYHVPTNVSIKAKNPVHVANNSVFNTYAKPNIKILDCDSRNTADWSKIIPEPNLNNKIDMNHIIPQHNLK